MIRKNSVIIILLSCLFLLSGCVGTHSGVTNPNTEISLIQNAYDEMRLLSTENQSCDIEYMAYEQNRIRDTLPSDTLLRFADPDEWSGVPAPSEKSNNYCTINTEGYRLDFYDNDCLCVTGDTGDVEWYSKKSEDFVTFYVYCNDKMFELQYHEDMGPF